MSKLLQRKSIVPVNRRPGPVSVPSRGAWWRPADRRRYCHTLGDPGHRCGLRGRRDHLPAPFRSGPPQLDPARASAFRILSPAFPFPHFSFSAFFFSLSRVPTVWVHGGAQRCTNVLAQADGICFTLPRRWRWR